MGYIYVLSNPSMPGMVKIGSTDRSPENRIAELSRATGIPTPFKLELSVPIPDHVQAERALHRRFSSDRVNDSREFFYLSVEQVHAEIRSHLIQLRVADIATMDRASIAMFAKEFYEKYPDIFASIQFDPRNLARAADCLSAWDDQSLARLQKMLFSKKTTQYRPDNLDAAIGNLLMWDSESLMKLIDGILSKRPSVRQVL